MKSLTNQELQEIVDEIPIVILNNLSCYICNLNEENRKLKKTYKRYNTMYNKLKSKIDKAIEYIKKATEETKFENDKLIDVLDILKGDDKEWI